MTFDTARLDDWLGDQLPGRGDPLTVTPYAEASNEILKLTRGDEEWILRKPPAQAISATAHNMAREARVLSALRGSEIPHAHLLAFCDDAEVIGAPFLVLELVDGFNPEPPLPPPFDSDEAARRELSLAFIDTFAQLESFDWRANGLEGFGKPDGFLDRQVDRWLGQLASYDSRDIPGVAAVSAWLRAHQPEMGPPALIHCDYQLRNVMVARDLPARLAAVIDWELATIGDPLVDLGHLLIRWFEAGEEPPEGFRGAPPNSALPGMLTRDELIARYAELTGRSLEHIDFYQVLAQFKLAVMTEGRRGRLLGVESPEAIEALRTVEHTVDSMVQHALGITGLDA